MRGLKWISSAIIIAIIQETICLQVLEVVVPGYRVRGESAPLECQYELQGDTLYSVKWYKDNEEFYRFMPKFSPPQHSYRIEGIKVDHHMSDDKKVMIKGVTLKSSGLYKCEVSAEAPGFSSASGEGRMEVIYLPKDGPFITETDKEYQVGETLYLNCTSGKSFPASVLHWYVNDEKGCHTFLDMGATLRRDEALNTRDDALLPRHSWEITEPRSLIHFEASHHQHGLESTTLGLALTVRAQHVPGGVRARCVASAPWPSHADLPGAAPLTDNREALVLVKSAASVVSKHLIIWIAPLLLVTHTLVNGSHRHT